MVEGSENERMKAFGYSGILMAIALFSMILDLLLTKAFIIAPICYLLYGVYIYRKSEFGFPGTTISRSYAMVEGASARMVGKTVMVLTVIVAAAYYVLISRLADPDKWFSVYSLATLALYFGILIAIIILLRNAKRATAPPWWESK